MDEASTASWERPVNRAVLASTSNDAPHPKGVYAFSPKNGPKILTEIGRAI